MNWVWIGSNLGLIGGRILEHLALTAPPIVIGLVLSIPLDYAASRSRVARSILLSLGGILYTIPSIALLVLVPVVLGLAILDPLNLVGALTVYAVQLLLNAVWTPIFFGFGRYGWALADIVLMWVMIGATVWLFRPVSRVAAGLLLPYWAWVTFATALNAAILRAN